MVMDIMTRKRVAGLAALVLVLAGAGIGTVFWAPWRSPPSDAERLLDELRGEHPVVPEIVTELANLGPPAVPVLLDALEDDNLEVRHRVCTALGMIRDPRAVSRLTELATDPREDDRVRRSAMFALGAIGGARALSALRSLFRESEPNWRRQAAFSLAGRSRDDLGLWAALLKDEDPRARKTAVTCLSVHGLRLARDRAQVVGLVRQAWQDDEAEVREAAVRFFSSLLYRDANVVVSALWDESARVRKVAAEGLGQIGQAKVTGPLAQAFADKDRDVRIAVLVSLGKIGSSEGAETLRLALDDDDPYVRGHAAFGLARIMDANCVDLLLPLLADPNWIARIGVVRGLAIIGAPETVSALAEVVRHDAREEVRHEAYLALRAIGGPKARKAIRECDEAGALFPRWRFDCGPGASGVPGPPLPG